MDYWSFVGSILNSLDWYIISACLAGVVIILGTVGAVAGSVELADRGRGRWIFLFLPGVIVVVFFLVTLLAWSGVGSRV